MESSLLRFNTRTTALPLPAPSPFHAANLRYGFRRRHFSFPPGKLSRSFRKTQMIIHGPIMASIQRTGVNEDQNMAGRVSLTLACVVGIIGYSFWLKRKAIAAVPGGGKGGSSSLMEYIARPEVMYKKPCPVSKANPICKCRRAALQKLGSEVPTRSDKQADEENLLQKPDAEVPGDKQDEGNLLQNPNSQVPGDKPEEEEEKNLQNPDSKVPAADKQEEENLVQNPNSDENLQTPNSGVVDSLEDLSKSKSVPQEISPPPHRGNLGSLLSASLGGLLSVADKRILPDSSQVATTDLVADDLSPSESPPSPAAALADMTEKEPKSELQGKKSTDPNLPLPQAVGKAEDSPPSPLLIVPQQAPLTVSQEADMPEKQVQAAPLTVIQKSIFPDDMAEKKTYKSDDGDHEELQGTTSDDVKVKNSRTSASDSGAVGAVDKASLSSSPSPLVSIIFKVDSSAMPSLALVSPPPPTTTPPAIEPARLGRSTNGETKVLVRGIPVSSSAASTAEQIFAKHGDVTAKCLLRDETFRANLVESLARVVQMLEEFPARKLSNDDLVGMQRKLEDLEKVNVNVGWLRERIAAVGPFLDVVESRKKWEEVATEVGRLGARLAELEAKLAEHEGAILAQKFADKADVIETQEGKLFQEFAEKAEVIETQEGKLVQEFAETAIETQRSTDDQQREEEDEVVHRWWLDDLGILCHAFGFSSLFYVLFMSKN